MPGASKAYELGKRLARARQNLIHGKEPETMKKFLSLLLAVMLLVAVMPTAAFAASTKTVYVSRSGGKIYLHTGPGYDYETTGTVKHNTKVTIKDKDGVWSKIKINSSGKTGWIRTMYVDGTTKELANGYKAINVSAGVTVKVYSTYSTSSSVRDRVTKGDTVRVNGTEHDFAKVTVTGSGVNGWIPLRYIGGTVDPSPEKPSGSTTYRTTASVLNVRSGPGTNYAVINQLPYGTGCTVLSTSGNWAKIKTFNGITGWVSRTYLAKQTTARVSTNGGNLNVRKGPGTYAAVLGSLKNGTKVTVKSTTGNWAYITYGKLSGYASLTYLKF